MLKKRHPVLIICFAVFVALLSACAGLSVPQSSGGPVAASFTGTSSGRMSAGQPDWVRDPYTRYSQKENIAVVGSGNSRQAAERNALSNLVASFGQDIQVDERVSSSYREVQRSGITASATEVTSSDTNIELSTGMDALVGAEFGEAWVDTGGTHYVTALLNKAKAAKTYTEMVNSNLAMIDNLTNIPAAEKNTLDGYARYYYAATISDVTITYGNLLTEIGAPAPAIKKGDVYRLEAAAIAKTIPIGVAVKKASEIDRAGRIQSAFRKALTDTGFQTEGANSRYVLDVNVTTSPEEFPSNQNIFTRIEVIANLTDSATGTVLLPFSLNEREGHRTQAGADNRAILVTERKVSTDYAPLLRDYLSRLLPKR